MKSDMFGKAAYIEGQLLKLFQLAVFLGFLICNIHFQWGATGIAAPVAGGMIAYYATGLVIAVADFVREGPRSLLRTAPGYLDAFAPKERSRGISEQERT